MRDEKDILQGKSWKLLWLCHLSLHKRAMPDSKGEHPTSHNHKCTDGKDTNVDNPYSYFVDIGQYSGTDCKC